MYGFVLFTLFRPREKPQSKILSDWNVREKIWKAMLQCYNAIDNIVQLLNGVYL